jgi:hypothetical protein
MYRKSLPRPILRSWNWVADTSVGKPSRTLCALAGCTRRVRDNTSVGVAASQRGQSAGPCVDTSFLTSCRWAAGLCLQSIRYVRTVPWAFSTAPFLPAYVVQNGALSCMYHAANAKGRNIASINGFVGSLPVQCGPPLVLCLSEYKSGYLGSTPQ